MKRIIHFPEDKTYTYISVDSGKFIDRLTNKDRIAFRDLVNGLVSDGENSRFRIYAGSDFITLNGNESEHRYDLITFYALGTDDNVQRYLQNLKNVAFIPSYSKGMKSFEIENLLDGHRATGDSLVDEVPVEGLLAVVRFLPRNRFLETINPLGRDYSQFRVGFSTPELFQKEIV
ncbi:MAG: hypothetical protein AABX11_06600 [Nanoarchaeota archaeon]